MVVRDEHKNDASQGMMHHVSHLASRESFAPLFSSSTSTFASSAFGNLLCGVYCT